jgi:hypothetical protein
VAWRLVLERGVASPEGYHDQLFGGSLGFLGCGSSFALSRDGLLVCLFTFYYFR